MPESRTGTIPESVFCMFQLTFAIIAYGARCLGESRVVLARAHLLAGVEGRVERSWRAAPWVAAGSAHPAALLAGVRSLPAPSPSA